MMHILITGAAGYLGCQLAQQLHQNADCKVTGVDIRPLLSVDFPLIVMDIRDPALPDLLLQHKITHVVHLAAIMSPGQDPQREYDIDVNGTELLLNACEHAGIKHFTLVSSGAAYGYHKDSPRLLTEAHPLRGNESFSYSKHKRLMENKVQAFARQHPETRVLVMRMCTILGEHTSNSITRYLLRRPLLSIYSSTSPFVFIWDEDAVKALEKGVREHKHGVYNVAGDGQLSLMDLASIMQKPLIRLPASLLKLLLWMGKALKLTQRGPEQVVFLQYRPVLSNQKLKREFGYQPQKSSRQAFECFWKAQQ